MKETEAGRVEMVGGPGDGKEVTRLADGIWPFQVQLIDEAKAECHVYGRARGRDTGAVTKYVYLGCYQTKRNQ